MRPPARRSEIRPTRWAHDRRYRASQPHGEKLGFVSDAEHGDLAYVAAPNGGHGPPVLVLHSWWGLTPSFTEFADDLAARGFLVGCADLYDGLVAQTELEARRLRARHGEPVYKRLRRCLRAFSEFEQAADTAPAVIGFSMGGHWAIWLAQHPDQSVAAVVLYYAARGGDFSAATAPVLAHFAETDDFVSASSRRAMERAITARGLHYTAHEYPGTEHWFAESAEATFAPGAAALALDRTASFLASTSR